MSLILAACAPAPLSGAAGAGSTEPPVVATDPPVVATDPPVVVAVASDTPVPTNTDAPSQAQSGGSVVDTATPTRTVTPSPTPITPSPTTGSGGAGAGANNVSVPTDTPTATSTPQIQAAAAVAAAVTDPYLGLSVACNNDLSATFTITNIGGPLSGGSYTVSEPGKASVTASFDLATSQSISFKTAGNATISVTYTTSELERVDLSAVGTCLPLSVNTATYTPTMTKTPAPTKTPTATKTATSTITPGPSPTPTNTKTPAPTKTPTATITPGPSPTPTNTKTPAPTKTPSQTPTTTLTPSFTPTQGIVDGQLDLQVFCNSDLSATFIIRNISGSVSDGNYKLSDPALSDIINLAPGSSVSIKGAGYATMTVTYKTSILSSVTLSTVGSCAKRPTNTPTSTPSSTPTGAPTNTPTNTPPAPPSLSATGVCSGINTGSATFVITNNGSAMSTPYTYNVTDDKGVVVDTGTFQLPAGGSTVINVSGSSGTYTLSSPNDNSLTALADMSLCVPPPPPPALSVAGACTAVVGQATFVVTNNGQGNMPKAYTYNVTDASGQIVDTNTFQLAAGASTTITVNGSSASYTFTSPDDAKLTTVADMTRCILPPPPPPPPTLKSAGACTAGTGTATFVITNNGADMLTPYTYNVTDDSGNVVQTSTFQLAAGARTTITVTGTSKSYSLASPNDGSLSVVADMSTCVTPPPAPVLSASGVCTSNAGEATFIITNTGTDMPTPYTYEVKDASGAVVKTATFQLTAGQSTTITVTGNSTLYTLTSPNDSKLTAKADMSTCVTPPPPPALTANGLCTEEPQTASFIITNNSVDMKTAYLYTVKDIYGNVIQASTPFQLTAGQSLTITLRGVTTGLILFITDAHNLTAQASMANCHESVPALAPAPPSICIQCLIFHTFRDENLEVYRLDGIEGQPGFKLYNLSKDEAVDSRPSRAPNDSSVVFQSNRDGNVELYYTDLLGSGEATRLTKTQSNNTNPMYGPDARTIVYQSDRNGSFDLFTIDQVTGKETQITSDKADDVNPFYSPDLKWIVFQSNRYNNWDIFALNVETGTQYQLTNTLTDETFPSWSPNGRQISYLVNNAGQTDLVIIDTKGKNLQRITVDGHTDNPVWSPEGNRIAYQSERNGNLDVYSYDLINKKEYRVTTYEGIDSGPTWDCGGTNLAFTSLRDGDPNIFQVFWQGGSAGNMTIDPATDKWSQWRPSNDVSSVGY